MGGHCPHGQAPVTGTRSHSTLESWLFFLEARGEPFSGLCDEALEEREFLGRGENFRQLLSAASNRYRNKLVSHWYVLRGKRAIHTPHQDGFIAYYIFMQRPTAFYRPNVFTTRNSNIGYYCTSAGFPYSMGFSTIPSEFFRFPEIAALIDPRRAPGFLLLAQNR